MMIKDLEKYFLPEQIYYLNHVNYKIIDFASNENELHCIDNISAEVKDAEGVRLIFTRSLKFSPEGIFELSVSFGVILKFNPELMGEVQWHEINLAEEFRMNGAFALQNLLNRASLLIAEITGSYGQSPIILPPGIAAEE